MNESYIRMNPLIDIVFSCIFQDMSGAPAMKELINAVLVSAGDEPIEEIMEMRSQYPQLASQPGKKSGRLDVKAKAKSGELFNIEVQLAKQNYFIDREIFYLTKMVSEQLQSGESYQAIPYTRVIAFLDFSLREQQPDFLQTISFRYDTQPHETASEKLRIYNIELPKFKIAYRTLNAVQSESAKENILLQWLYILTNGYLYKEETDMLSEKTEGLANFTDLYKRVIADQDLRDWYEYELSSRLEENSKRIEAEEREKKLQDLEKTVLEQQKAVLERERAAKEREKNLEQRIKDLKEAELRIEAAQVRDRETAKTLYTMGLTEEQIAQSLKYPVDVILGWIHSAE